jgi:hypothetical protein
MKIDKTLLIKVGLSIVLISWLGYTIYWFFKVIGWVTEALTYTLLIDWLLASIGTLGLILRIGASLTAILAVAYYLRNKGLPRVIKLVRLAIIFEAFYFLTFIPSVIFGFQVGFGFSGGHTLLSGEEGGLWFIFETFIPTLVEAIIMPISLLKLRSKLTLNPESRKEIFKWGDIVGVSYIIVFWLTYFAQWIASFIQPKIYASLYHGYGLQLILNHPLNMFTFILTSIGLPLLAVFVCLSFLPAIRDPDKGLSLRRLGIILTLLGGYFITVIALFRVFGPVGGDSIWIIFFMYNNADHWCIALPALGIPLILSRKRL